MIARERQRLMREFGEVPLVQRSLVAYCVLALVALTLLCLAGGSAVDDGAAPQAASIGGTAPAEVHRRDVFESRALRYAGGSGLLLVVEVAAGTNSKSGKR